MSKINTSRRVFKQKMILNRPVKPLSGFMVLLMLTFTIYNIANKGVLSDYWLGSLVAVLAFVSAGLLFVGWVVGSQLMNNLGLLIASFVYIVRAFFVFLLQGPLAESFWLSLWTGCLVGAAFYLEVTEEK